VLKSKRLDWRRLGHDEVGVVQQLAQGPQDQIVGARFRVDLVTQLHPKVLNCRFLVFVDDAGIEGFLGDVEVGFDL
jgi:hypothetical protein